MSIPALRVPLCLPSVQKHPEASPFRNDGWRHYNDMVHLIPTANTMTRRRPLTRNNGDHDVDLNSIDPKKSESSHEESLDSEAYVVVAEAVRLAIMCVVESLMDDDFLSIEALEANPEELPSSMRFRLAMERLQKLEDDLDDDQLLTLIDLFRADSSSVDAYLNLLDFEDLRKAWVQAKLGSSA